MALLWVRDSGHVSGGLGVISGWCFCVLRELGYGWLGCCCSCAMCATRTKLPAIDNRCSALPHPTRSSWVGRDAKSYPASAAYQHHCTFCWRLKHFSSCCTISGPSFLWSQFQNSRPCPYFSLFLQIINSLIIWMKKSGSAWSELLTFITYVNWGNLDELFYRILEIILCIQVSSWFLWLHFRLYLVSKGHTSKIFPISLSFISSCM